MTFFYNYDLEDNEIEEIIKEKAKEQEQYIQEQYQKNIIIDYKNNQDTYITGKSSKKKQQQKLRLDPTPLSITSEQEQEFREEDNSILMKIKKMNL